MEHDGGHESRPDGQKSDSHDMYSEERIRPIISDVKESCESFSQVYKAYSGQASTKRLLSHNKHKSLTDLFADEGSSADGDTYSHGEFHHTPSIKQEPPCQYSADGQESIVSHESIGLADQEVGGLVDNFATSHTDGNDSLHGTVMYAGEGSLHRHSSEDRTAQRESSAIFQQEGHLAESETVLHRDMTHHAASRLSSSPPGGHARSRSPPGSNASPRSGLPLFKRYECEYCGRVFSQSGDMKRHVRVHTGEKPYGCVTCGKMFRLQSHVNKHMRVHTGELPYKCAMCQATFELRSMLEEHKQRAHHLDG
jgi:DNA-directed RNA polymerase subunit RPC12/RpoP